MNRVNQRNRQLKRKAQNSLFTGALAALMILAVTILLVIILNIAQNGIAALNLDFFIQTHRPAGTEGGGIAQAITGTLIMLGIAALCSVPLGFLIAIYLVEYKHSFSGKITRFVVDLLLQMPSIVIGIFVWATLVRQITGFSGTAGAVALMFIITPIVVKSVEEILLLVPPSLQEAGYALGLPQWRVMFKIVIPNVLPGLVTAVILALARAAGETAPILLTALGNDFFNTDPAKPMAAIPLQIFTYSQAPSADLNQKAWGATLVLILVIAILSMVVRTIFGRATYDR